MRYLVFPAFVFCFKRLEEIDDYLTEIFEEEILLRTDDES